MMVIVGNASLLAPRHPTFLHPHVQVLPAFACSQIPAYALTALPKATGAPFRIAAAGPCFLVPHSLLWPPPSHAERLLPLPHQPKMDLIPLHSFIDSSHPPSLLETCLSLQASSHPAPAPRAALALLPQSLLPTCSSA